MFLFDTVKAVLVWELERRSMKKSYANSRTGTAGWKERIAMISNEEYRKRIHDMVDDIENNYGLRQICALIYRMHERDVAKRIRTEIDEGAKEGI